MTDLQLLYDACLRAERRLEEQVKADSGRASVGVLAAALGAFQAITTLREEIGRGLAEREGG